MRGRATLTGRTAVGRAACDRTACGTSRPPLYSGSHWRSVAQPGSAPRSGRGGRRFKSCHSDHQKNPIYQRFLSSAHHPRSLLGQKLGQKEPTLQAVPPRAFAWVVRRPGPPHHRKRNARGRGPAAAPSRRLLPPRGAVPGLARRRCRPASAIDMLQEAAEQRGLVAELGQDAVQATIAAAFVAPEEVPNSNAPSACFRRRCRRIPDLRDRSAAARVARQAHRRRTRRDRCRGEMER
jgi:hypothetical protein